MISHLATNLPPVPLRTPRGAQLQEISTSCSQCQRCVAECQFLKNHGDPKQIAEAYDPSKKASSTLPFECSLCGLCTAVCPTSVDPAAMFLEMRRESVERGIAPFPGHTGLQNYEKKGTSKRFSWYALPDNCETIFFPGCSLPGSRPEQTRKTFELLQAHIPALGIVLDCCTKPSHDLGRQDYFQAMFGEMKQYLLANGIKTVLVACPNCDQVFSRYAPEFTTKTVYEILDTLTPTIRHKVTTVAAIHDPCVARFAKESQTAVRNLAKKSGLEIVDTGYSKERTLCCGEGGAVAAISPQLADGWGDKQARKTTGNRTVTYCSGCANKLNKRGPTNHILDLYFDRQAALSDRAEVSRAPLTYWNRLKLKKYLQTDFSATITRERTFQADAKTSAVTWRKLMLLPISLLLFLAKWNKKSCA